MRHELLADLLDVAGWCAILALSLGVAIIGAWILRYALLWATGVLVRLGVID